MHRPSVAFVFSCSISLLAACGGDDDDTPPVDAATPDVSTPDSGVDPVERGRYLVDHVAVCTGCHTPRNPDGSPDLTNYLAGVECFVDIDPTTAGFGCLHSRNLTNDPTGLMTRSDEEIKTMFRDGVRPNGAFLNNVMPYWVFHNMTDADADAIVAYLRTVPGVDHAVPANEMPFDNVPAAATPLDDIDIPAAVVGDASAENGRYLASKVGVCVECHTQHLPPGTPGKPIDINLMFQGGEPFPAAAFGLPVPPFPDVIYSANITSHTPNGIGGRTEQQVVDELLLGMDPAGAGVCPPMPVGPMGEYGGLTQQDAQDIAHYIVSLPPGDYMVPNGCAIGP
jgi:mono/diheme cytochrome c family protein